MEIETTLYFCFVFIFQVLSWKSEHVLGQSKDYLDEEYVDLDQVLADQPVRLDPNLNPDQLDNPDRARKKSDQWIEGSGDDDDEDGDDDDDDDSDKEGSGNEEFGEEKISKNIFFIQKIFCFYKCGAISGLLFISSVYIFSFEEA